MGKRSRNKPEPEPVELSVDEQVTKAEQEYRGLKRMMTTGLIGVGILIVGLALRQPDGWVPAVIVLGLIEGVSYFFLRKSLERRREERIERIKISDQP